VADEEYPFHHKHCQFDGAKVRKINERKSNFSFAFHAFYRTFAGNEFKK
jgi:hypothetical protein